MTTAPLEAQYTCGTVCGDQPRFARGEQHRPSRGLREHLRDGVPRRVHDGEEVGLQQPVDLVVAALVQLLGQRDARIAEEDVDRAVALDAHVDGAFGIGATGPTSFARTTGPSSAALDFARKRLRRRRLLSARGREARLRARKRSAQVCPMPVLAPVMTAALPASRKEGGSAPRITPRRPTRLRLD